MELGSLFSPVALLAGVFVSTNLDDLLVLSLFFADLGLRAREVVVGQFVGIGCLTGVSAAGALLALQVAGTWLGFLGFVPIALGVHRALAIRRESGNDGPGYRLSWTRSGPAGMAAIALVTVANGGDNLGVYALLFVTAPRLMPLSVPVFAAMTAVWCLMVQRGVKLANRHPRWHRNTRLLLPLMLVLIGLSVVWHAWR